MASRRWRAGRKRAVTFSGRVFFLISVGSPHVRPMGRTCGEPTEIELTPIGVELNGSGRAPAWRRGDDERVDARGRRFAPARVPGLGLVCFVRSRGGAVQLKLDGGQFDFVWLPARAMRHTPMWCTCGEPSGIKKHPPSIVIFPLSFKMRYSTTRTVQRGGSPLWWGAGCDAGSAHTGRSRRRPA